MDISISTSKSIVQHEVLNFLREAHNSLFNSILELPKVK